MVGNVQEWVGDWLPPGDACPGWLGAGDFSTDDRLCIETGDPAVQAGGPGVPLRGGFFFSGNNGANAGPFDATELRPQNTDGSVGFRGVR